MARLLHPYDEDRHGRLEIEQSPISDCAEVYYVPPQKQIEQSSLQNNEDKEFRAKILELDNEKRTVSIFPINTMGKRSDFLKPKYRKIKRITISSATPVISTHFDQNEDSASYSRSITFGPTVPVTHPIDEGKIARVPPTEEAIMRILESLPPIFTRDYDYGLGLAKPYRCIVDVIEGISDCEEILISAQRGTEVYHTNRVFCISRDDFESMRKSLNNTIELGRKAMASVKATLIHNFLADRVNVEKVPLSIGRHPLRKKISKYLESGGRTLTEHEADQVLSTMTENIVSISQERPHKLARLQRDIEVVNLERLISRFEEMMIAKSKEPEWQHFFEGNPFVLNMAFGYPIVVVQGRASVGGRAFSGRGEKFTDFLVKNSMTNNAAIVEIKTPTAKLLNATAYRGDLFVPSTELSGGINQALDQKHRFERQVVNFKDSSRADDIETYSIQCCLIIGRIPRDGMMLRSFELFRSNSKDVEIITFDELLTKLKSLLDFVSGGTDGEAGERTSEDRAYSGPDEPPF